MGDVIELANILGFRVASLPKKYLDLPLGASYKARSIWNGVIGQAKLEETVFVKGEDV